MADEALCTGQVLCGRYRLQHLLGQGGMGRVWQASHLSLETDIAIKFLDPRLSRCDDIRSRFAQEATAAASIKSPHVVTVLDSGFTEQGHAFIAMELLRGEDLGRRLARDNTLAPALTATIIGQACRGLGRAHAMGIIHRDVKPENLFLSEDDTEPWVKLLDFGIAKSIGTNSATYKTDTGQILGTPVYMSPEQALGRTLDVRSDLYSLAVVAYRCLVGRPPFLCSATGELIVAVSTRVPPLASSLNPTLPPSLDAWFSSMLLKDPDARCAQSARELADSFAAACDGVTPAAHGAAVYLGPTARDAATPTRPERAAGSGDSPLNPTDAAMSAALVSRPGRHMRIGISLAVSAVLILAVLGSAPLWWSRRPPPEPDLGAAVALLKPAPAPLSSLRLSASPPAARLWLDGAPLGQNPYVGSRPLDAMPHQLRAEAPGHEAEERSIRFEPNVEVALVLRPSAAPTPSAAHARAPRTPRKVVPRQPVTPPPNRAETEPAPAPPPRHAPKTSLELDRSDPWRAQ